jgi:hypothetical protein
MALTSGTDVGLYEILAPLGAGWMGELYRARDSRLAREVVIKVLPSFFSRDPDRPPLVIPARGARGVGLESSQHHHDLRDRPDRLDFLHRDGTHASRFAMRIHGLAELSAWRGRR